MTDFVDLQVESFKQPRLYEIKFKEWIFFLLF